MKITIRDKEHARILETAFNDQTVIDFHGISLAIDERGYNFDGKTTWTFGFREAFKTKWNGEGRPPVGTVCEMRIDFKKAPPYTIINLAEAGINVTEYRPSFQKAKILYASNKYMIVEAGGTECMAPTSCVEFRMIKTPEQIADDKRREQCTEIANRAWAAISNIDLPAPGISQISAIAEALFEAGYHK